MLNAKQADFFCNYLIVYTVHLWSLSGQKWYAPKCELQSYYTIYSLIVILNNSFLHLNQSHDSFGLYEQKSALFSFLSLRFTKSSGLSYSKMYKVIFLQNSTFQTNLDVPWPVGIIKLSHTHSMELSINYTLSFISFHSFN